MMIQALATALKGTALLALLATPPILLEAKSSPVSHGIVVEHVIELDDVDRRDVRAAAEVFVWALSNGVAEALWRVTGSASQAVLMNPDNAYETLAINHPALATARGIRFQSIGQHNGVPVVELYVTDSSSLTWKASIAVSFDSEGDPQVVGADVEPAPGILI